MLLLADENGNIPVSDLILGAAGNINGPTGKFFTVLGGAKIQLSNEVKVGDIQVSMSIKRNGGVNNSHFVFSDLNIKDEYYGNFSSTVPANWQYYEKKNPDPDIWFDGSEEYYQTGKFNKDTKIWFDK